MQSSVQAGIDRHCNRTVPARVSVSVVCRRLCQSVVLNRASVALSEMSQTIPYPCCNSATTMFETKLMIMKNIVKI